MNHYSWDTNLSYTDDRKYADRDVEILALDNFDPLYSKN